MTFRILVAFFCGLTAFITGLLIPVAYFGDKNETWATRLIVISFIAGLIFIMALFW